MTIEPYDEIQTEVRTHVLMNEAMRSELERRAARFGDEGVSPSRFTRMALREYFRRHQEPVRRPGGVPLGAENQRTFVYLSRTLYVEIDRHRRFAQCSSGRVIRAALQDYFRRHPTA